jgi:hypothetical protein
MAQFLPCSAVWHKQQSMAFYPVPKHPWVSAIEAPLYLQTFPRSATDIELAAMIAEIERITKAMQWPYGWVADLSDLMQATARQRSMCAESDKCLASRDERYCAGSAVYCRGALTRGVLTAVHWLSPPAYPFRVFSSFPEAESWARQQLIRRGVAMAPGQCPPPVEDAGPQAIGTSFGPPGA